MSAEYPQPTNPEFEQLTIPFEAAYSTPVTTEELNKNPLAGVPSEWLKPADNAGEVQSHDVDQKLALKGILRVKARIQARRERNQANASTEDADASNDAKENDIEPSTDDTTPTEPESAFAKVAREAKEGRFDGKSMKQRAQEKLEARKAKKFATSKEGRIAKLEEELSGASSTIAVKKDGNWTEVKSMRTYKLDTEGKKRIMTNEQKLAYEQKVDELNALRGYKEVTEQQPSSDDATQSNESVDLNAEIQEKKFSWRDLAQDTELPLHQIRRYFDTANPNYSESIAKLSPEDRDAFIARWVENNPHTINSEITSDVISEFIDELKGNPEQYGDFASLSAKEQDQWIIDWFYGNADPLLDDKEPTKIPVYNEQRVTEGKPTFVFRKPSDRFANKPPKPHKHPEKLMTRVLGSAAAATDRFVDRLDGNTLGKGKTEKKPEKKQKVDAHK